MKLVRTEALFHKYTTVRILVDSICISMTRILCLAILLSGCAAHRTVSSGVTGSPCFDGIVRNIAESGCDEIIVRPVPGTSTVEIRCAEILESQWTKNTFYFVQHGSGQFSSEWTPVCSDPSANSFFFSREGNIVTHDSEE